MVKASSESNRPENFYHKPRLDLEKLGKYANGEFIAFSGHMGSDLAECLFAEPKLAYSARTYDDARALVHPDWKGRVEREIRRYQQAFGKENFYLEIQLIDQKNLPASLAVARILRWAGKQFGVQCVATADSHYARREDAQDQRILLCSALETSLKEVQRKIDAGEDVSLGAFFKSNNYHIPSLDEMKEIHTPEELACSVEIAARCETPNISGKPLLPSFSCENSTPDKLLWDLCQAGWKRKVEGKVNKDLHETYRKRLEEEYKVLTEAGLSSYFLIVQDYVRYAIDDLKCRVGEGRGSAAGCLVSYLMDITNIDPIKFGLLFIRFYSSGRNVPSHVSFDELSFNKFGA